MEWERKRMELYSERALSAAQKIYGIVPPVVSGNVANGPMAGHPVSWSPQFLRSRENYRLGVRPDGSDYYMETVFDPGDGGITDEDGRVNIGIGSFYLAAAMGDTLFLALTVHHEGFHFWELLTRGWDTHEAGESRAWGETVKAAEAMGAGEDAKKAVHHIMAEVEEAARQDELNPPFHSEKIQFDVALDYERTQIDSHIAAMERKALDARLESMRAEAAGKSEEAKKAGMLARLEEEAARCGFKFLHPGNWNRYGFYEEEVPGNKHLGAHYYFARGLTWDEFRTVLFLARACLDEGLNEPCNDGLDIINRRWGKDGFGEGWELAVEGGQGGQKACLEYLQGRIKPPMNVRGIDKAASRAWKDLRKRWKREGEAAMRRHRQQQAEAERPRKRRDWEADDSDGESRCGNANSETGIVGCRSR